MDRSGAIQGSSEWVQDTAPRAATAQERRTDRVRSWRRRVLQKRGALLRAAMARDTENCSLAMLDETGMVVSWYGHNGAGGEHVVDRHVSQFYIPEEIARNQPLLDLRCAVGGGARIRQGWMRQADGTTFWGSVIIEAIHLRDGRLQGFSYVSRACEGPPADVPVSRSPAPRTSGLRAASHLAPLLLGLAAAFAPLPSRPARTSCRIMRGRVATAAVGIA